MSLVSEDQAVGAAQVCCFADLAEMQIKFIECVAPPVAHL